MSNAKLSGTYLGHSGFLLELPSATLLFDWSEGDLPPIRGSVPFYVFISHVHSDHFRWQAFGAASQLPQAQIFLGYDRGIPEMNKHLGELPDNIVDLISCFDGEQKLYSDDDRMLVRTLRSTDLGVAFLVEIDGMTIYHAGDLALWAQPEESYLQWYTEMLLEHPGEYVEDYSGYHARQLARFREYIEPLRGLTIDYGMLPLDSRIGESGRNTIVEYMNTANFKAWTPMHLWGQYDCVGSFAEEHPEYASNMIGVTSSHLCRTGIAVGEKYTVEL